MSNSINIHQASGRKECEEVERGERSKREQEKELLQSVMASWCASNFES